MNTVEHFTGYEESGKCWWCGGELPKQKRVRHYCCEECRNQYWQHFNWQSAVRLSVKTNKAKCQLCGSDGGEINLEAHHIIPVNGGSRFFNILNVPCNVLLLCHNCHQEIHARYRELDGTEGKPDKVKAIERQIRAGQVVMDFSPFTLTADKKEA
jgi:5-methylcytosine-specific restriction endonuclease McrA